MLPKPKKGAYARRRKLAQKMARWTKAYYSEEYVRAFKREPCVIARLDRGTCAGGVEAAHIIKKTRSTSRGYLDLVPLCQQHHAEQEGAEKSFDSRYGLNSVWLADFFSQKFIDLLD